ncbi:hypothetical protein M2444_004722 [Paenibacillus sp. PastF-3]|uniref:AP2/ERF family transcription factor n=1 Tax=Paenibacillus sp. PastF-3 TaxID=2940626 RepID=UPI0024755012|nr:AP2/ERF family transcription factor [Paenibacillus sp. PastF-3]MDH6372893.1 hypothetical protein [Paenibacillus sp. PastF-3]
MKESDGRKKSPVNTLDLKNKKFGLLLVVERAGSTKNGNALWLCQCDCGGNTVANGTSLRRSETISCGCQNPVQIANARGVLQSNMTVDGVQVPLLTKKVRSDSGSGHKGVSRRNRQGKECFEVSITVKGKRISGGTHKSETAAIAARKELEEKYHQPYIDKLQEIIKHPPTT